MSLGFNRSDYRLWIDDSLVFCAYQQNKFWEMHDLLLNEALGPDVYESNASGLGLNVTQFQTCMKSKASKNAVDFDEADAESFQVLATPTVLLFSKTRTIKLTGALPLSEYKKQIDDLLTNF